jgi:hypothetical protein
MLKVTGAKIDNKIVEVIEVKPYDEERNLVEVFFMFNGITKVGAIVKENDLIKEEVSEVEEKTRELVREIEANLGEVDIDVDEYDEWNWVYIDADVYTINVLVDIDHYAIDTLNKEKCNNYGDDEDLYKNSVIRKTLRGTINYIKKFI